MSLKVYFGNNLIDEEYYTGLTNSYELFNDSFKLGTTPSNIYKLSIAKEGVTNQPSNVILKENNTTFAELEIDNIEEQDYTYNYDLTDKMLDLEFYYDASEIFVNGKTTLLAIAQDICSKAGLTLGTTNFRGYNKEISWYDNRRTAREYIGFIAELNGGFARVENSTLYFRKQKTSSVKTIDIDDCENFIIGEYHKITRVVYELGALKYEFGDETGNTLYLNSDNVFITEESEVQAIYNDIKDFEFYSFETGNCPIDYSVKAGDIITFTDGTNNYPTIAQYDLEYFGTWIGGYSLSVNTERQEETKVVGNTEKIKNLQVIVDRDANTITQLVETTEEIEHQFETLQDIDGFAEGKYIYLDDASDELITSAKFYGETTQETRESSRNIFNKNAEINKSMNAASKTTLNTGVRVIADSGRAYNASVHVVMKLGNTTDLVGKTIRVKTTATPSANNLIPSLGIAIYSNDYSSTTGLRKVSLNAGETGTLELTYTVSQNNNPNVGIVLYLTDSSTTSAGDYTDFENLMVTVDDEDMTYEPYGVMPSPDYPSEIENVKGKNLLKSIDNSQTINGITFTLNEDKSITVNGTATANALITVYGEWNGTTIYQKLNPDKYYTISGSTNSNIQIFTRITNGSTITSHTPQTNPTFTGQTGIVNYFIQVLSGATCDNVIIKPQLEEGSKASSYVPYNSLEVKVIGKNLLDKNKEALGSNVTKTVLDTGIRVTTKVAGNARYCGIEIGKDELLGKKVTISANIAVSGTNNASARLFFGKYNTPSTSGIGTALTSTGSNTVTIPNTFYSGTDRIYLLLYSNVNGDTSIDNYVDYTNLQVEIGEEATDYEEHKEQIVYFPLAEGQKLYEGSYLADDGIHNVRGQIIYDGSSDENWIKGSYPRTGTVQMQIQKPANFFTETGATAVAKLNCSHFKSENQVVNGMALGGMFNVYPSTDLSITTVAEFKTWLSNNPMTLEYPLVEEEIIPYNTEQQAAWNSIKSLHTYKNITHIYSDAYAEIGYIKDNMLSAFETKASAQLTKNDVSQLKIENGRISSEVSSTQSQLNNYYTKNEADNNTNSTKAELENIIQQNKTQIEQTTQEIALRVNSIETNGVDKIETSIGYTFDNNGMNIDKEGAATASTIDNEAFKVKNKSANENVFFAGYVSDQSSAYRGQTIVESTNLVVKNYLNIEGASRFQPYVNPVLGGHGTGAFDIG